MRALAVLQDGRLASAGRVRVNLWDLGTYTCVSSFPHPSAVTSLAVLPDGQLASGSEDGQVRLWDPVTGALSGTFGGHGRGSVALAVFKDGRLVSRGWCLSGPSVALVRK